MREVFPTELLPTKHTLMNLSICFEFGSIISSKEKFGFGDDWIYSMQFGHALTFAWQSKHRECPQASIIGHRPEWL